MKRVLKLICEYAYYSNFCKTLRKNLAIVKMASTQRRLLMNIHTILTVLSHTYHLILSAITTEEHNASETGQGLIEYALILILVAVTVVALLVIMGPAMGNIYSNILSAIRNN